MSASRVVHARSPLAGSPRSSARRGGGETRVVAEAIAGRPDLDDVVARLSELGHPVVLEFTTQPDGRRLTICCAEPTATFEWNRRDGGCPWRTLEERIGTLPRSASGSPWLFGGGWIGHIAYEAGAGGMKVPARGIGDSQVPALAFARYDHAAVFDHDRGEWFATAIEQSGQRPRRGRSVAARLARSREWVEQARRGPELTEPVSELIEVSPGTDDYLAQVRRVSEYIGAGDVFQANLARRFRCRTSASAVELFLRGRRINPAPYSAFIPRHDYSIISCSPELFLFVHGDRVITRPIKGTRPRGDDPSTDDSLRRELAGSVKDQAELNMIIDLMRNDLGRACAFGSVIVGSTGDIEAHPTVWHRVATVEGRLRESTSPIELLRGVFPCGSITGAPKRRAMQIIRELEPFARGVYCGAIGFIGLDGTMGFNVAIRTIVQRGDTAELFAGGGIVADSVPAEELAEVDAKAAGMLRTIGVEPTMRTAVPVVGCSSTGRSRTDREGHARGVRSANRK